MPKVTFIMPDGEARTFQPPAGLSLLEIAHKYGLPVEGACEGSLACSTCHVYVADEWFDALDMPSDDEEDMLDLAFAVSDLSRLGCQIIVGEELDGLTVTLPAETHSLLG